MKTRPQSLTWLLSMPIIVALQAVTFAVPAADAPVTKPKPAATKPATAPRPAGSPTVASPRDGGWMATHERFVETAKKGTARVVFLGDSITAGWGGPGKESWAAYYAPISAVNFGIGGDRTEHVLYRITNGELDHIKPKALVLMIGTNNLKANPTAEIAKGVTLIVNTIRNKLPETKILLLGVFPRGANHADELRVKVKEINDVIAKLHDGKTVHYLDIGPKLLDAKGAMRKDVMPDMVHLTAEGYAIEVAAINPKLEELLGEKIVRREPPATQPAAKPVIKPSTK